LKHTGRGNNAKILSIIAGPNGDRTKDADYDWKPSWQNYFIEEDAATYSNRKKAIKNQYERMMNSFKKSIELK
jgi:hypothetical protein